MPAGRSGSARDAAATRDLQVRAAWLYHVEALTQEQISRLMAISRAKVVRLLQAAREEGVVRIRVGAKSGEQIGLERRLVERFGLGEAIVAPSPENAERVDDVVGHAAAIWLLEQMQDGMSIGVGWGATLDRCARSLGAQSLQRVSIVSLLGGMTHSRGVNPSAVARRIADAFGANCYQLTAPLLVADEALRAALWAEPGLAELRDRARGVALAMVSVGDVSEQATLFREGLLPPGELSTLIRAGAVGDLLGHFVDATGREVEHPVRHRVVALDLEDLRRVPRVVIVSGGQRKIGALAAALMAVRASVLITDESAARGLVAT